MKIKNYFTITNLKYYVIIWFIQEMCLKTVPHSIQIAALHMLNEFTKVTAKDLKILI